MITKLIAIVMLGAFIPANSGPAVNTWGHHESRTPVEVSGLPAVSQIQAANWGGLAIGTNGDAYQWMAANNPAAQEVSGPTSVVSVGEGGGIPFGAAVTSSGRLWTWGHDQFGELCDGNTADSEPVSQVPGVTDAAQVQGGAQHLLILTDSGTVEACGQGTDGELGDGTFQDHSSTPVQVRGLRDITAISAGNATSYALDSAGTVWAWGENNYGQLGNATTTNSDVPVQVELPSPAVEVFAGGSASWNGQAIALLKDGSVYAWGNDKWGQLGNGISEPYSSVPVQATALPDETWSYVASGGEDGFALDSKGELWEWGDKPHGHGPDGGRNVIKQPKQVASGVTQVSAVAGIVEILITPSLS